MSARVSLPPPPSHREYDAKSAPHPSPSRAFLPLIPSTSILLRLACSYVSLSHALPIFSTGLSDRTRGRARPLQPPLIALFIPRMVSNKKAMLPPRAHTAPSKLHINSSMQIAIAIFSLLLYFRSTFRTFASSRSTTTNSSSHFRSRTRISVFFFAPTGFNQSLFFLSFLHPPFPLSHRFNRLLSSSYIRLVVLLVACNSGPYESISISYVAY